MENIQNTTNPEILSQPIKTPVIPTIPQKKSYLILFLIFLTLFLITITVLVTILITKNNIQIPKLTESNTSTISSTPTSEQVDPFVVAKKLFSNYLEPLKLSSTSTEVRITDYKVEIIDANPDDKNGGFCSMVKYSVKPLNMPTGSKASPWEAANGERDENTGWINNKTVFIQVDKINGEYTFDKNQMGTSPCGKLLSN